MAITEQDRTDRSENTQPPIETLDYQGTEALLHWLGDGAHDSHMDHDKNKTFLNHLQTSINRTSPQMQIGHDEVAKIGTGLIQEVIESSRTESPVREASKSAVKGIPMNITTQLPESSRNTYLHEAMLGIANLVASMKINIYNKGGLNLESSPGDQVWGFGYYRAGRERFANAIVVCKSQAMSAEA